MDSPSSSQTPLDQVVEATPPVAAAMAIIESHPNLVRSVEEEDPITQFEDTRPGDTRAKASNRNSNAKGYRLKLANKLLKQFEEKMGSDKSTWAGKFHMNLVKLHNLVAGPKQLQLHKERVDLHDLNKEYLEKKLAQGISQETVLNCGCRYVAAYISFSGNSGAECQRSLTYRGITTSVQFAELVYFLEVGISKRDVAATLGCTPRQLNLSHLCHLPICHNPNHVVLEIQDSNYLRNRCRMDHDCSCHLPSRCRIPCHESNTLTVVLTSLGITHPRRNFVYKNSPKP